MDNRRIKQVRKQSKASMGTQVNLKREEITYCLHLFDGVQIHDNGMEAILRALQHAQEGTYNQYGITDRVRNLGILQRNIPGRSREPHPSPAP